MKRCPMSCTCYARQRSVPFLALQSKTFLWSCGKSNHNEAHITKPSKFYSHSPQKLQNQGEVILELSKTSQRGWVLDSSILRSGVCVCVDHLKRCKTSKRWFGCFVSTDSFFQSWTGFSNSAGGRWGTLQSAANEDAAMFLWKRTCNFPVFRQWQPAKPRTGMSFFQQFSNYCTVFAIWLSCIRTSKPFE